MDRNKGQLSRIKEMSGKDWLAILAIVIMAYVGFQLIKGSQFQESDMSSLGYPKKNVKVDYGTSRMNVHVKSTDVLRNLAYIEANIHNQKKAPKIDTSKLSVLDYAPEPVHRLGIVLDEEDPAGDITRSLENNEEKESLNVVDKLGLKMAQERWLKDYDRQYTHAFVAEVKARALEDGYIIEFDQDLNLVSVREVIDSPTLDY